MKIIELLNKIANGEEVPKKVKYRGEVYDYINIYKEGIRYTNLEREPNDDYGMLIYSANKLNDEIEIIEDTPKEEKKIPEKINWKPKESMAGQLTQKEQIEVIARRTEKLKKEFNEIIDFLKSKGDE